MAKPRMHCVLIKFEELSSHGYKNKYRAHIHRIEDHPQLGPPRSESFTVTSLVLNINFETRTFETLNSIYRWE